MDNRSSSAEWERQREHESSMQDKVEHIDDFVDSGTAIRYFQSNRGRILHHFGGSNEHVEGAFNWYTEWEKWARQQWEQKQRQQGSYTNAGQQQQQQNRRQRPRQESDQEFQWDFNPNDPYVPLRFL